MLIKKIFKSIFLSGLSGSSLFFFYKNDYSFNNIGLVRFSRVGVAVIFF